MIQAESGLGNIRPNTFFDMNRPIYHGQWRIPEKFHTYDSKHELRSKAIRQPPQGRIINIEEADMTLIKQTGLTVTLSEDTFKKAVKITKIDPVTGKVTEQLVYPFLQSTSVVDKLLVMKKLTDENPGSSEIQRQNAVLALQIISDVLKNPSLPEQEKQVILDELSKFQLVSTNDAMNSLGRRFFDVPNELKPSEDTLLAVMLFMLQNKIKALQIYNSTNELLLLTLPKVGTSAAKNNPILDAQTGLLYTKEQANALISGDSTINDGVFFAIVEEVGPSYQQLFNQFTRALSGDENLPP